MKRVSCRERVSLSSVCGSSSGPGGEDFVFRCLLTHCDDNNDDERDSPQKYFSMCQNLLLFNFVASTLLREKKNSTKRNVDNQTGED